MSRSDREVSILAGLLFLSNASPLLTPCPPGISLVQTQINPRDIYVQKLLSPSSHLGTDTKNENAVRGLIREFIRFAINIIERRKRLQ